MRFEYDPKSGYVDIREHRYYTLAIKVHKTTSNYTKDNFVMFSQWIDHKHRWSLPAWWTT